MKKSGKDSSNNILVTGASGFIGSHLVKRLEVKGHTVLKQSSSRPFPPEPVDLIYHLGAYTKISDIIANPDIALSNFVGVFHVLEYMRKHNIKQLINASSTEVEGLKNPYGGAKLAGENLITSFCHTYGMGAISVRFSNIYGPEDRGKRFIPTVIRQAQKDADISVYGEGGNYVYIDDCIDFYLQAQDLIKKSEHLVYKVDGDQQSLIIVAEEIIKLLKSKSKIKIKEGLFKCIK